MANSVTLMTTCKDVDRRNNKKYDILTYRVAFDNNADLIIQPALSGFRSGVISISYSATIDHVFTVKAGGVSIPYNYVSYQAPFFTQGKSIWITDTNEDMVFNVDADFGEIIMQVQVVQWRTNVIIPSFGI